MSVLSEGGEREREVLFGRIVELTFALSQFQSFKVGKWSNTTGAQGLWPTSLKNLRHLAKGEGFSWYFHDLFNGNEASYLRWKEVFDVLGIVGVKGGREGDAGACYNRIGGPG